MSIFIAVACVVIAQPVELRSGLAVSGVTKSSRSVVRTDPVEAAIVAGGKIAPKDGDVVGEGPAAWKKIDADEGGTFPGDAIRSGYLWVEYDSPEACVRVLDASGHGMVFVNGEPRAGDPYGTGQVRLPVALNKGVNTFLFTGQRGVRAKLSAAADIAKPVQIDGADATLPDAIPGENDPLLGAIVVQNTSRRAVAGRIVCSVGEPPTEIESPFSVGPLTTTKTAFEIPPVGILASMAEKTIPFKVTIVPDSGAKPDSREFSLAVRRADQTHARTYRSGIDGSVQYCSIVPPIGFDRSKPGQWPTVLSLHGASVEARGQAGSYAPKKWCAIVCPTNRRPYGFDWEDWGRVDAFEALAAAGEVINQDPSRIYVTGHSMGGHGTWQLAAHYPGVFAAAAPSAGWCSFWTYQQGSRQEPAGPVEGVLYDAGNASDTTKLIENFGGKGVAILHGDADDNVPVREARAMRDALKAIGVEPVYHEQPGAGHWWGGGQEPGALCVDWPEFFDLFASRRLPAAAEERRVKFVTVNPAVSSQCAWASVLAQNESMRASKIDIQADPHRRAFTGTTENVRRLALRTDALVGSGETTVVMDGQTLAVPSVDAWGVINLEKKNDVWSVSGVPDAAVKGPSRAGPFKHAFNRNFVLVYGTGGTPEENAWAMGKARFDAEVWWVRGNGSASFVSDTEWLAKPRQDCNVILYGHDGMNKAWGVLRTDCPVRVSPGSWKLGATEHTGEGACVYFTFPREGEGQNLVGVIAGTGMPGMRVAFRTANFLSGVGIPDLLVLDASLPGKGAEGVTGGGFFGHDWSEAAGRFAWR